MSASRLILIDGSAYIFRAFHALPPMNRKDGTPVNAVFGFTSMVMKLVDDLSPDYVIVVLDKGRETFRNEIYPEYKANRGETPPDLIPQFPLIRDAVTALGLPMAEYAGYEADDLIAAYTRAGRTEGMEVVIVSSDKDLMQLVGDGVMMLDPMKQKHIREDEVFTRFGVMPDKVIDVQALAGDSSDNVPGVAGIGVKTAAELINTYGDLDNLLARAEEIKQPKRRETLIAQADQARLSRRLVTLDANAPMPIALEETALKSYDEGVLAKFLTEQNFSRLLARINMSSTDVDDNGKKEDIPVLAQDYHLVRKIDELQAWIEEAREAGVVAVDTETTSITASAALIVGVSLATAAGRACYIPLRHQQRVQASAGFDFGDGAVNKEDASDIVERISDQLDPDEALAMLKPLFEDPSILKVGHNLKYDGHVLSCAVNGGIQFNSIDDTMLLSFILDAGIRSNHKLDDLAYILLDHQMIAFSDVCGKGTKKITFDFVSPEDALNYAAEDADMTLRLWQLLKPRLAQMGKASVYERLERPLVQVLIDMEAAGVKVDVGALRRMSKDFEARLGVFEGEIHALAGETFNIASPKQLGAILFDKLELPHGKKSKTGAWSTSVDVLEGLAASGAEIAEKVLAWRHLAKLKSTYADALVASIHKDSGRVHTSFSMVGASTGRLSSSDPNVQNIPIRTEEGRQIRKAFVAEQGGVLISADYSQIELRLVAHIAGEASMINAFKEGIDIHAQTASEVFGIPLASMSADYRRRAKAINFGIIYGISGFGLARQLGIPQDEARSYIKEYFARFPGIKDYMNDIKETAKDRGFVETLFGRRLYIRGITASNGAERGFAERQAINAPIQGTAADIIKKAMVRMPASLAEERLGTNMLLQVHDELVFEAKEDEAEKSVAVIKKVMENAAKPTLDLQVPLIVEANIGNSWDEAH